MALIDTGSDTAGKANVDANFNLQVAGPGRTAADVVRGGGEAAGAAAIIFSENDPGSVTGARLVYSPETDDDYRLRIGSDTILDSETFNYTAQNTGKHAYVTTTMTAGWTATGLTTNALSITTTTTGTRVKTWAEFPVYGPASTYFEAKISFSALTCPSNVLVDFGPFRESGTNPFTPTDGAYFSLTSAGLVGACVTNSGTPQTVALPLTWVVGQVYKFTITVTEKDVEYWINDVLYGTLPRPTGAGQPFASTTLPWCIRQAHVGAAGGVFQVTVRDYTISLGGLVLAHHLGEVGNMALGAYQGLSGGTMGQLAQWANTALPTAAAGTNTTAALGSGLGGLFQLNAPATSATDVIISSYQAPAGTVAVQGRRYRVNGVWVSATNLGAAVATTETAFALALAFGHTAVSLATAEGVAAKAPRRIGLGNLSWAVGSAIGAPAREGSIYRSFTNPIYLNPGEFVAVVAKILVGTATASEVFAFNVGFDAGPV